METWKAALQKKSRTTALTDEVCESVRRVVWKLGFWRRGISNDSSTKLKEEFGGGATVGRWWKVMEGVVAETRSM